ncbi:MAG: hypothetical protein BWY76_03413 [bacterium ADurb.Bin429]|nr:MAG: hypothetical protein BWY76_03413 [bacterium ADurb.Bin429]
MEVPQRGDPARAAGADAVNHYPPHPAQIQHAAGVDDVVLHVLARNIPAIQVGFVHGRGGGNVGEPVGECPLRVIVSRSDDRLNGRRGARRTRGLFQAIHEDHVVRRGADEIAAPGARLPHVILVCVAAAVHQQIAPAGGNGKVEHVVMLVQNAPGADIEKAPVGVGVPAAAHDQLSRPWEENAGQTGRCGAVHAIGGDIPPVGPVVNLRRGQDVSHCL